MGGDVGQAAVGPAPTPFSPAPSKAHHLLQLPTNQVRRGGAEGDGGLQHLEVRLVAEVRPPGGETVTSQRVGVERHLLQGREGGEEVSREEAQLVTVDQESPEGGQLTEDTRRGGKKGRGEETRRDEGKKRREERRK